MGARWRGLAWGAVLLLAGGLCGCSGGQPKPAAPAAAVSVSPLDRTVAFLPRYEHEPPENGGTFTMALPVDPVTLNPILASDRVSYMAYKWIFDPLIDMDADMKPVGVLAQSWENSPDNRTTTFHLRKGVLWQDGKPFTADDVLFSYRAAMDPAVDAVQLRPAFDQVAKVEKVDDYTVRVTWKEPFAPGLAAWVFYIIPEHVYGYAKGKGASFNQSPANQAPVGTGPFRLEEWKRGDRLVLTANDQYWRGRPHLDRLILKVIPKGQTQLAAYETGQLDMAGLSSEQWDQLRTDPAFAAGASIFEYYARQFFYLGWNMDGSNPFFADRRVRQAMTYALNRQGVVDSILGGHGAVAAGPFYPMSWSSDPRVKPYPYDPAKASALLDEAGWKLPPGKTIREKDGKPFSFECLVPAEVDMFSRWLEVFQQDLKRVGVDMRIRKAEWSVFLDRTHRHQFQAYLSGWGLGDDPDPYPLLDSSQARLLPSGMAVGQNDCSYANPEVDRLIGEEERTFDLKARQTFFWQIQRLVAEDQPMTFLFWPTQMVAVKNRFQDVRVSRAGYGMFTWYPSLLDWWVPKELQKP